MQVVLVRFVLMAVICLGASQWAWADVILTSGNIPQTDENVLLNSGLSGNPIFGFTNQTSLAVRFGSNEDLTAPAAGQARVEAVDGAFTALTVDIFAGSFTSLILNLDGNQDGTVDFTAVDTAGDIFNFLDRPIGASGENFYTFTTINGQRIATISLVADVPLAFVDAAQFRIGGALLNQEQPVVPEPASIALLGIGLVASQMALRKRGRRARLD